LPQAVRVKVSKASTSMVTPFACSVQLGEELRYCQLCRPNAGFHYTVEYLIRLEVGGEFRFFTNVLIDSSFLPAVTLEWH